MKQIFLKTLPAVVMIASLTLIISGCKSKTTDADIKTSVEAKLKQDAMSKNMIVDVKEGVVTLSGECENDSCKQACAKMIESIEGVKSVVNNCTIAQNPDDVINKKISEIISDYPYIKIGAMNGIVSVAGSLKKDEWQKLKIYVDNLHPKGYDTAMLRIE